ncbi:hypothetical protein PISMIDRAFT_687404 [Pisolithus microcarpus 441]|uniref:Uncharacterized protein n=1 Tax=Pisolithus microcarpus 441 TaxID=765257 RepID=A0A0C9XSJ3_9AGAM|nr:hypothetical protein BKA83DRAFT_687404 [Pisolithus microcarpus]KIK15290.1 hypothetical protein PISMIDRAFT_687404 [Pisolithus microcarpus 441]
MSPSLVQHLFAHSRGSKSRSLPHSPVTGAIDDVDGESSRLGGSMRAVCDALRSISSINHDISSMDDGFQALKRGLDIENCSCGIFVEPEQSLSH